MVGSANFTESNIIAEIYSQALAAKGIESSTKLGIGSREVYIKALQDKSIAIVPEYTGNLLLNFDKDSTAKTAEEVETALPEALPADLKVLKSSAAVDQDVYVVSKAFSEKNGVTSLADLSKISGGVTVAGFSELETRDYGPKGLTDDLRRQGQGVQALRLTRADGRGAEQGQRGRRRHVHHRQRHRT